VAFDLEGRGLSPLSELLELADFPLAEFLPEEALASAFDRLSYTDAAVYDDGNNIVLDLQLVFEQELALRVPGSDAVALVFGSAGPGFTSLFGTDVGYMADADPTEEYVLMREAGLSYPRILPSPPASTPTSRWWRGIPSWTSGTWPGCATRFQADACSTGARADADLRAPRGSRQGDRVEPHGPGGVEEAAIVARQLDPLAIRAQEVHRGEMEGVQRSHRNRKWFQRSDQYRRRQLDEPHTGEQRSRRLAVRARQAPGVKAGPDLVLDQAA
jgi:hypothetical protein